jgi:8-oxo-dGTP pyrophosphatase MutT (NUDIX family)
MDSRVQQRLSAGVVVVRNARDHWRFLLLRAFSHWDFPKGMVEAGEDPSAAAVREVLEETSVDDLRFDWGVEFIETGPYSRGKIARYYIGRTERRDIRLLVNPEIGRPEHVEFRWVGIEEALRLTTPRVRPVIHWAAGRLGINATSTA